MNSQISNKKEHKIYKLLVFSLFLLLNPNFHIIDFLPDFIAYFIIARLLEKAADSAAYFEEARSSFLKLAYVTLAKIPAMILISYIRTKNTHDNDVYALFALVFAILELIYLISAIKNIFDAVFHLGERADAPSLISPYKLTKRRSFTPEALRSFCFFFAICKCVFYVLPQLFILTTTNDYGITMAPTAKYYPYMIIATQVLGFILGIIWFVRTKRFVFAVYSEGKFDAALEFMQTDSGRERFLGRVKLRKLKYSLTALAFASFFSLELIFTNLRQINLLPHFLYGIILLYAMHKSFEFSKKSLPVYISGSAYIVISAICYVFSFRFLNTYGYIDLISEPEAMRYYSPVLLFTLLEAICLLVFLTCSAVSYSGFIHRNTGLIDMESEKYSRADKEYHKGLVTRVYVMFGLGLLAGISKCVNVFLNREISILFSDITDVTKPTFATSPLPWFGLVVFVTAAIYIGYSLYLTSNLKEEIEMKYADAPEDF